MKRCLKYLLLIVLCLSVVLAFVACDEPENCTSHVDSDGDGKCDNCKADVGTPPKPDDKAPDITGITFEGVDCYYDAQAHTVTIAGTLPDNVTVKYENNSRTEAGEQQATAKFYYKGEYIKGEDLTAFIKIRPLSEIDLSDVTLPQQTVEYSGSSYSLAIVGVLPEDVTVTYEGNGKINASDTAYEVTAKFYYKGIHIEGKDITSELKINKKDLTNQMYGIEFNGKNVVYTGDAHSIQIEGDLPEGVSVSYTGNGVREVGEHTVVATFTISDTVNYTTSITELSAKIKITKADYNMSRVSFSGDTVIYDGNAHSIKISGILPSGVTVEYFGNGMVNAGTYEVIARFTVDDPENYNEIPDMKAALVIKPVPITASAENGNALFDGKDHSANVVFDNGVNEGDIIVTVTGTAVARLPGVYLATYSFSVKSGLEGNYQLPEDITVMITINHNPAYVTEGLKYEEWGSGYAVSGIDSTAKYIVIPSTYLGKPVLSVNSRAFEGNTAIEYVYLPNSVTNIGNRAFAGCSALSVVRLGAVENIGQEAFQDTAITEIVLPDSLTSIGIGALAGTKLEKITLPFIGGSHNTSNSYIGYIFGGSLHTTNRRVVPSTLKEIVLSDACKVVPAYAFYGLSGIENVVIGNNVTEIGNYAFKDCSSLTEIFIPGSVVSIPASAQVSAAPFYGTSEDMMIVCEEVSSAAGYGKYFSYISDTKTALVVYNKTYEDYLVNKDSYRISDPNDATLAAIYRDGVLLDGFDPNVTTYNLEADINKGYGTITVLLSTAGASAVITSADGTGVATIKVTSLNGEVTKTYTINFTVTGTFGLTSKIVNKNGADGTVSFVVDDGYHPTATWLKSKLQQYANLSVSFTVKANDFATLATTTDEDGLQHYVFDDDGNYTYTVNQTNVDFWRDILSVGGAEIVSHSQSHAFWGYNDLGGSQLCVSSNGNSLGISNLPLGSARKEVFASLQIIKDLFGDTSRSITFVTPGIAPKVSDYTLTQDLTIRLNSAVVRLVNDTEVYTAGDGKLKTVANAQIDLQSAVITLPADSVITTTADGTTLSAGTLIKVADKTVTVPAGTLVKGSNDALYATYADAIKAGVMIGSRLTGQRVYTASDFATYENRIKLRAYMITASTNDTSVTDAWIKHIDNTLAKGGYTNFCIHAITDSYDTQGEGGHKITKEQADILFAYTEQLGDRIWVATQTDAMLYFYEWSTAKVDCSYEDGKISVSLTDEENDEVFNMPLTIKVSVPGTWAVAYAGGSELTIRQNDDGTKFVYVDVAPESTVEITEVP